MAFRIGQKVVCVDRTSPIIRGFDMRSYLVDGAVYTITAEVVLSGFPVVHVAELPTVYDGMEIWFQSKRFRPVTEKQTDISTFTEILNRENKNSRVPVSDHQSN